MTPPDELDLSPTSVGARPQADQATHEPSRASRLGPLGECPSRKVTITPNERAVLLEMYPYSGCDEEPLYSSFRAIYGVERHLIRRTVRSLARKGLTEYAKGLWTEDGEPRGAGYSLTKAGRALARSMGAEMSYE